ncbi:homoserine kinase [Chitinibacteraceae bacterium HSL-7]
MSVFTTVSPEQLRPFLARYAVGELVDLKGIAAGVTNTNYFVTTTQGRFVLTLFETLQPNELPYYVNLMAHLAGSGIAVAAPVARDDGAYVDTLNGKPTLMVTCVPGEVLDAPNAAQCHEVGAMLARMHVAGQQYAATMDNPRGPHWWRVTAERVYRYMPADAAALLERELDEQQLHRLDHLPVGVIHADLFRDNVLLDGNAVGGFIDFYYACNDVLLYDVAITLNDWCVLPDGDIDAERARALLAGYQSVRALTREEVRDWPIMLRAAAIRFWTSRLIDFHEPAAGEMTFAKDPGHFERVLRLHIDRRDFWL